MANEEDTRNVDKNFINIPAAVTPTPKGGGLSEAAAAKEFTDFTYTATSCIDGQRYSVSFDTEDEFDE